EGHPASDKNMVAGVPTAYICGGRICSPPLTNAGGLGPTPPMPQRARTPRPESPQSASWAPREAEQPTFHIRLHANQGRNGNGGSDGDIERFGRQFRRVSRLAGGGEGARRRRHSRNLRRQ